MTASGSRGASILQLTGGNIMPAKREHFVHRYGGIYEHSAWVAEQAYDDVAVCSDVAEMAAIFAACVDNASDARKLELIRAHPDLAGKAAIAGQLTQQSSEEQASAGIDRCSPEEFALLQTLNARYKEKFGFPFVMAVRDSNRQQILDAFAARLENDGATEFARAIAEIHKIARLRLEAMQKA
jgi:2-oxo-4-hydroxy-4-carboxy-5-ureidoimidazoline decarboxylase